MPLSSDQVDVRSVEALESLDEAIGHAQDGIQEFLLSSHAQLSAVLDWITEREHEAQRSVSQAEDQLRQAEEGLGDCVNASYDEDDGPHDTTFWDDQVAESQRELGGAEVRLDEVRAGSNQVRAAADGFLQSARQLDGVTDERMRLGRLFLQAKTRELNSYLALNPSSSQLSGARHSRWAESSGGPSSLNGPLAKAATSSRFFERGILSVVVADIPDDQIGSLKTSDFHKYSYEEMLAGAQRFDVEVRPRVENGATREYFQQQDRESGSDYSGGLERLYDAYYGTEPIRITKLKNGRLEVTNGRHRLFVAKQAGIRSVPASFAEEVGDE